MKRSIFAVLVAVLAVVFSFDMSAAAKKVAVFVEGNITKEQKAIVNSAVMSRLSTSKEYKVYERSESFTKALDKEFDYQLGDKVPETEVRKIASRYGVDYVIVVNAEMIGDEVCLMSARLIDIVSGEVLKTCNDTREYEDNSTITALANNVAYRLLTKKSK